MIQSGRMRDRVTLQSKTVVRDVLNGETVTWVTERTVFAEVRMINGREVHAANQMQAAATISVRIRKGPAVTVLWRLLWTPPGESQRILNIASVLPTEARDGWDLLCSEGLNDG